MKRVLVVFLLTIVLLPSCKKDDDKDNTAVTPVPDWLIPLQGFYQGTYDGGDEGTWTLTIANSPNILLSAFSTIDQATYNFNGVVNEDATIEFSGIDITFTGDIQDYCQVSGTYANTTYGNTGTFEGWKEPASTDAFLRRIANEDGKLLARYEYDGLGRHIKTQNYDNNIPTSYGIREWLNDEYRYTFHKDDGSLAYQYIDPLPLNQNGLAERATYTANYDNMTRYDTIIMIYDAYGYLLQQQRGVTLAYNAGNTIKGSETRTYTYAANNLVKMETTYDVGTLQYSFVSEYEYSQFPDHSRNLTPFLGRLSTNLSSKRTDTYSGGSGTDITVHEYFYEFYSVGLVKKKTIRTSNNGSTTENVEKYYYN